MRTFEHSLTARGILSPEHIAQAKAAATTHSISMEQALLDEELITEQALQEAQATFYGLELFATLPERYIDHELICRFSISYLKRHQVVPLKGDDCICIGMATPAQQNLLNDFALTLGEMDIEAVLLPQQTITQLINSAFGDSKEEADVSDVLLDADEFGFENLDDEKLEDLLDDSNDAPFIKLVNMILTQAVRAGASDVHIEPFRETLRVRFRLDGVLYNKHTFTKKFHAAIVSRIKIMAKLNIAEKRLPQDGRIPTTLGGREVDLRVSTLPTSHGERIVMRLLEKSTNVLGLNELGLCSSDLELLHKLTRISHGIILVTGPTGSGKTTSLYAALSAINSPDKNIMTIEDPVEYQLEGIGQIQVNTKTGLTFSEGLRSIVRQDPDVILIGEIRDKETADIAIQSALTGHLVFSTLHTNDAPSAVTRLMDMGVEPFLLSSVLRAVVAQRLVRVLCPHCKEAFIADASDVAECETLAAQMEGAALYRPTGCEHCMDTGYKGRQAIYEIMQVSEPIKNQILHTTDSNQIRSHALADGMKSLKADGCQKVLDGHTSVAEILRVSNV